MVNLKGRFMVKSINKFHTLLIYFDHRHVNKHTVAADFRIFEKFRLNNSQTAAKGSRGNCRIEDRTFLAFLNVIFVFVYVLVSVIISSLLPHGSFLKEHYQGC
jgi:hypothetical protein